MPLTPEQRILRARMGGYARSAKYDGREVTAKARDVFNDWEAKVDPDGLLSPKERKRRAEAARKQHFTDLAYKSSLARAKKAADTGRAA